MCSLIPTFYKLIFCLDDLSIVENDILKSPGIIVLLFPFLEFLLSTLYNRCFYVAL